MSVSTQRVAQLQDPGNTVSRGSTFGDPRGSRSSAAWLLEIQLMALFHGLLGCVRKERLPSSYRNSDTAVNGAKGRQREMMMSISKTFEFSASHLLEGLPSTHKCSRLHGHSYQVRIECEGTVDGVGFVIDYSELDWVRQLIKETLDHRHLNDVLPVNPTAENIAAWLWDQTAKWLAGRPEAARIHALTVAVSETRATWASMCARLGDA